MRGREEEEGMRIGGDEEKRGGEESMRGRGEE